MRGGAIVNSELFIKKAKQFKLKKKPLIERAWYQTG